MTRKTNRLMNRIGKRPCDICSCPTILVEHHIRGRDVPNYNHKSNIANVCPNCHMQVHSGMIVIEKWVNSSNGMLLAWHEPGDPGLTGENATPYQIGAKHEGS